MAGKFMAMIWAAAGGVLLLGAFLLLGSNIMFAMMAAGLAVACLLVAGACVLKPSTSNHRFPRERDGEASAETDVSAQRRKWGPR